MKIVNDEKRKKNNQKSRKIWKAYVSSEREVEDKGRRMLEGQNYGIL